MYVYTGCWVAAPLPVIISLFKFHYKKQVDLLINLLAQSLLTRPLQQLNRHNSGEDAMEQGKRYSQGSQAIISRDGNQISLNRFHESPPASNRSMLLELQLQSLGAELVHFSPPCVHDLLIEGCGIRVAAEVANAFRDAHHLAEDNRAPQSQVQLLDVRPSVTFLQ